MKRAIAVTTDLESLALTNPETKKIIPGHDAWSPDGKVHVVIMFASQRAAEAHMKNKNGAVFPHHGSPNPVGSAVASLLPKEHGVLETDTTWQACEKIANHWGLIDPTEF